MNNTLYFTFKIIHIISGCVLFSSAGITAVFLGVQRIPTEKQINTAIRSAWFITLPALFLQLLTGFTIIGIERYSIHLPWVWGTFLGFLLFSISWLCSVYFLTQRQLKLWRYFIIFAFCTLLTLVFLMSTAGN